jgi:hypothetical protein
MGKLKSLKSLPKADVHLVDPPPLQFELPHKVLARLTADQERLTQEIREHKTAWAQRNFVAQNKRQTISSAELTAFRDHHTELSAAIATTNIKIGEINREPRANKAARQNRSCQAVTAERSNGATPKKECPMKRHKEFPVYFLLAAEGELDKKMFDRIVSIAKSLLSDALKMGIETE